MVWSLLFLVVAQTTAQELSVLHIKVALVDADKTRPVPHHALLISDNPATAEPRRVVTGVDGTADVRLRPGNYTVESDEPVAFRGKAYQWTQTLDIVAGRDRTLELTTANAEVADASTATRTADAPLEADPSFLLPEWQASVVSIWTPLAHASGFVVDANGLVATSRRAVGAATSVEVQLTPDVKVAASVLASDAEKDVAVFRIDPTVAAAVRPLPLGCTQAPSARLAAGQKIFTIGALPLRPNDMTSGTVSRVDARTIASDLLVPAGSEGGPVFSAAGAVVGISSAADGSDTRRRKETRVVPIDDACQVVAAAEKRASDAPTPGGGHLPVEPSRPFPEDALKLDAKGRAIAVTPYSLSSSDFDVVLITPPLLYAVRSRVDEALHRERSGGGRGSDATYGVPRQLIDFGDWSDYVADVLPVLLVRATPRLVEGFWTKVARGAAMTQGMSVPAITHVASGFSRMRVLCGDREVTPIHPFKLETHMSETETIDEGLYVFGPDAFAPSCESVRLVLFSQKQPDKADTRIVDARMVQRIWDDFAAYRTSP
jgi:S1-C subfamily serine protease